MYELKWYENDTIVFYSFLAQDTFWITSVNKGYPKII